MENSKTTKSLWMRVGISFNLTEDEFRRVETGGDEGAAIIREKIKSGSFRLDGETYAPQTLGILASSDQWPYKETISYEF